MIEFTPLNFRKYKLILTFSDLKDKTGVFIAKKSILSIGTFIGDGTRINGKIIIKGKGKCSIKKYCAIGDNVRIITSNHKTDQVNLQYALQKKIGIKAPIDKKINVEIENNVWLGDSVIILPGVNIGNGAVIAAGTVVTKDIPPYAIVAGVPGKLIKYRFSEESIKSIEESEWWDWSIKQMKNNKAFFTKEFKY